MATTNKRLMKAYHGGATTTTANFNGIAAGGLVAANISRGYEDILSTPMDGVSFPEVDRLTQFVRGTVSCQDWTKVISVLNGTVGTYIFYVQESGGVLYSICTITAPVISAANFQLTHRGYGQCDWVFECKAASETAAMTDMFAQNTGETIPDAALTSVRALEITALAHGAVSIYHTISLNWSVAANQQKASQDGDVGYTAVDNLWGGIPMSGSLVMQEGVGSETSPASTLLVAAVDDLVATVRTSQGGAAKTLTLKNVLFTSADAAYDSSGAYVGTSLNFVQTSPVAARIGTDTNLPYTGDVAGITIA